MKAVTLVTFIICAIYMTLLLVASTEGEMDFTHPVNSILSIVCTILMYQGTYGVQSSQMASRMKTKYACFVLMFANFLDGFIYFWNHYNKDAELFHFALRHMNYMVFLLLSYMWCQELVE